MSLNSMALVGDAFAPVAGAAANDHILSLLNNNSNNNNNHSNNNSSSISIDLRTPDGRAVPLPRPSLVSDVFTVPSFPLSSRPRSNFSCLGDTLLYTLAESKDVPLRRKIRVRESARAKSFAACPEGAEIVDLLFVPQDSGIVGAVDSKGGFAMWRYGMDDDKGKYSTCIKINMIHDVRVGDYLFCLCLSLSLCTALTNRIINCL